MRSEVRRTVWGLLLVATLCPIHRSYSQPTPGRSYEEVVVNRHQDELQQIPGVYAVRGGVNRVMVSVFVHTDERGDQPATLPLALQAVPTTIEGLPVEIQPVYILPPPPGVVVVQPFPPDPQTEACPPESVQTWNLDHLECFAIAETCPDGFQETTRFDWRFCMNPGISSTIENPMNPPHCGDSLCASASDPRSAPGGTGAGARPHRIWARRGGN